MMDTLHRGLLTLVKSAVTEEKLPLPEGFSLKDAEKLIKSQSLMTLVYRGALNCGIDPLSEVMQRYQVEYFRYLLHGDRQVKAVERVFDAFEKNGIDYLPLKGYNLKKMYPSPELRIMVDADILIRLEQYDRIRPIMEQLGFEEGDESLHELNWCRPELHLELHKRLFAPNESDLYGYFGEGWGKAVKTGGCRYDLTPEDEFLYVFTHMAKHFRYGGIGVRQILDLYVYRRQRQELDEEKVRWALDHLGLGEFYQNINRMLDVWFGDAPDDALTDFMTEFVFNSGNFGTLEKRLYSEELINLGKKQKDIKNSKGKSLFRAIFPPMYLMQMTYGTLYKYPWLYPVFWVVRCVDVMTRKRDMVKNRLKIIQGMTDEKLEAHQQTMNLMGLSLNFMGSEEK
jgi:hypothetical protein